MQPRASFASDSARTLAVRGVTFVTAFANGIIAARWLGPEGVGVLALLALVHRTAFRLGSLGFGHAFSFFVARGDATARELVRVLWLVSAVMSVVTAGVLLALRPSLWGDIDPTLFALALLTIPGAIVWNHLQRLLSGQLRIREVNTATLVQGFAHTAGMIALVVAIPLGIGGAMIALIASEALGAAWLVARHRANPEGDAVPNAGHSRGPERSARELVRPLWDYGRWTHLQMLSGLLLEELPLVALKAISGDNAIVGLFTRARGLTRYPQMVVTPVANVLFSYTAASAPDRAVRRTNLLCRGSLPLLAVGLGAVSLLLEPIIGLLYGAAFLPAVPIFYAAAPGILVYPLTLAIGTHMAASGQPRPVFTSNMIASLAGGALAIPLILSYGGVGAGAAVTAIYFVLFAARGRQYTRLTGTRWRELLVPRRGDLARVWPRLAASASAGPGGSDDAPPRL